MSVQLVLTTLIWALIQQVTCLENYTYDFIIVGGGTAGCALARRLTDDGLHKVLLIESGDLPLDGMEIPAYAPDFLPNSNVTLGYPSLPQRYAARQNNGVVTFIGGRVLGGSSSINYMWFNRGNPQDYDNWANITHDDSWKYRNMLKYFKRVETYNGDFPSDQHGYQGPISITRPRYAPGLDYWLSAGKELGYPIADPNGPQKISFAPVEFSKDHGRRVSSFTGYLKPILSTRSNLHVILNTNVTKILFRGVQAVGVQFTSQSPDLQNLPNNRIYASKEIIISAGVIGSPLLLQRSGVGPHDLLEAAGIPLIKDLPVGSHFQDQVSLPISIQINNASAVMDETRDLTPENLKLFNILGDGPYSNTIGGTGQAFTVSSTAILEGEVNWPDLHICMAHSDEPYLSAYLINNIDLDGTTSKSSDVIMSASVFLVRPRSRGSVYLNPKNISDLPILDFGYFEDPRDIQSLLDAIKITVKIFESTKSYQRLGARVLPTDISACQNRVFKSDQYWKCYIRQASQAGLHAGGTCRMGWGIGDPEAVVDSKLRVIGLAGLRVVDASVMPVPTNVNTMAAVYGIAEKAADMILSQWNNYGHRHRHHLNRFI